MENEKVSAGKEVLSYCGKCKLALAHIIISMKNKNTIANCECKTCSAQHKYRDPQTIGKKRTTSKTKKTSDPIKVNWQDAITQAQGTPKSYTMEKTFKEGDIINHPKFGKGVVEKIIADNKIQALFEHETKLLVCAR